jgi:hypothetical protein
MLLSGQIAEKEVGRTEKNQIEMPEAANSVAQTPPPAAAKAAPYEAVFASFTVHPELSFA